MKMNVYQEISQIIKEADGILIGASNGLSIAEGYNIFADDAWFQRKIRTALCFTRIFSANEGRRKVGVCKQAC